MLSEIFSFVLQTIFWLVVFNFIIGGILNAMEIKNQQRTQQLNMLDQITHRVQVEQHGEVYYWFDADDGEFLGQGKDTDSIIQVLRSRFPKHVFFVSNSQNEIWKLHGPSWQLDRLELKINA